MMVELWSNDGRMMVEFRPSFAHASPVVRPNCVSSCVSCVVLVELLSGGRRHIVYQPWLTVAILAQLLWCRPCERCPDFRSAIGSALSSLSSLYSLYDWVGAFVAASPFGQPGTDGGGCLPVFRTASIRHRVVSLPNRLLPWPRSFVGWFGFYRSLQSQVHLPAHASTFLL
jgi:hypothetical protein